MTSSAELRSTAKWVITALAAVATVVFGAGPIITRPSLSFQDDVVQLVLAFLLGVAGLIGIGVLIFGVSKVLMPVEMSLDDLPQEVLDKLNSAPETLLPAGIPTLAAFQQNVAALRTAVVEIPEKIEDYEHAAGEAQRASDAAAYAQATDAIKAYQAAYHDDLANLATYEAVRKDLIDRGAYTKLSRVFSDQSRALWAGALLAGIGGLGFQLALTSAPDGEDADPASPSYAGVAVVSGVGDRATAFWERYKLADCEASAGEIPVLVTNGDGTEDSPYSVVTIPDKTGPDSSCPAIEFLAHPDVFEVVTPSPDEITVKVEDADD